MALSIGDGMLETNHKGYILEVPSHTLCVYTLNSVSGID